MTRHVFIVGCGFPQLGLVRTARKLGFEITGADLNPSAIAVELVDHFVRASTGDAAAIVEAFRRSGATGITTSGSELALTTTAQAAADLGAPFYADPDTVDRCQAKDRMRAGYLAAGLPVPRFVGCRTYAQAEAFASSVGFPVVVKPAHGWGQRGIARVDDARELRGAFEHAMAMSHGGGGAVVEQRITGHELSVNGWVEDGELRSYCVTDREVFPGKAPLGVMRSEVFPSILDDASIERGVDAARRGARALGLMRGPCYSQVAVTSDSAVLFETAARLGGGFDADVTRLATGVDLYARLLGVAFDDPELERRGCVQEQMPALVRFLRPVPGILERVVGLEDALRVPGVVDAVVYPRSGERMLPMVDAAKRAAHILVRAHAREAAVAAADAAEAAIRMVVTNDGARIG